ncbi:phist protein [Plasmodium cynomolgi strain B]|uniref:Phist protein n=1 Tax=Plasmodium cynomolgi (strain B) TaxID=1120755 RepID=K6UIK7_PLACD|nr:phist protein [Plasmodium cynomolgi strain B]GAB65078.1 phist protein [Plasmodium cynomolgi strain B]
MDGDLCGRGCFHGGSGSGSSLVANKNNFKNCCTRSLEKGNKIITGRIYTKVARSRIFILFVLTLLNLFLQNMYYKNEEWKPFSKLELSMNGCSRKLAQIKELRECANLARQALRKEDSEHLRKYKEQFYKKLEEKMNQVGPDPLPSCMKKGDKIPTVKKKMQFVEPEETTQKDKAPNSNTQKEKYEKEKNKKEKVRVDPMGHLKNEKNKIMTTTELKKKHDDNLHKKISKEEMKEILDCTDASNYENIQRKKNVFYNEYDNDEFPRICMMKDINEKITENALNSRIAKLWKVVSPKDMFIIWHYIQALGRDKYLRMNGELWKACGQLQEEYNIPNDIKKREWQDISHYMTKELLEKEHNDYLEFKELVKKGSCERDKFQKYIDNKMGSWRFLTTIMMDSWKETLIERLKRYKIYEA